MSRRADGTIVLASARHSMTTCSLSGRGISTAGRDLQLQSVKFLTADQIRHRAAFEPAADQLAIFLAYFRRRGLGVAQAVEIDPLAADGVGQQHFRVEPGRFDPFLGEVLGGPVQQGASVQTCSVLTAGCMGESL